jgi:hypothetical protein
MRRAHSASWLLLVAALSFWAASAIHFALTIPLGFMTVSDLSRGAAVPEAILGFVVAAAALYLNVARSPRL